MPERWRHYVDFPLEHLTCVPPAAHPMCLQDRNAVLWLPQTPIKGGSPSKGGCGAGGEFEQFLRAQKGAVVMDTNMQRRVWFCSALPVLSWPIVWICGVPIPQHGGKENRKLKIKTYMGAKLQYLRAESPAFSTRTAIPKCTKPGHTLGIQLLMVERCLAAWGEDLSPGLTEEINLFWTGFRPLQSTGHQLCLALCPWLCKTDSVTSRSFRNFTMFSFSKENLSPAIKLTGLIISCWNVLCFPFETSISIYPVHFCLFFVLADQIFPLPFPHRVHHSVLVGFYA